MCINYNVFPRKIVLNKYLSLEEMTVGWDMFQWHITELENLKKYSKDIELAISKEWFINSAQESQESFNIICQILNTFGRMIHRFPVIEGGKGISGRENGRYKCTENCLEKKGKFNIISTT